MKKLVIIIYRLLSKIFDIRPRLTTLEIHKLNHVSEIEISNPNGSISIEEKDDILSPAVSIKKYSWKKKDTFQVHQQDSKAILSINGGSLGGSTKTDFHIKVPSNLSYIIQQNKGIISINGNANKIKFKLGNGKCLLRGKSKDVNGHVSNGIISFDGNSNNIKLQARSGNIGINIKDKLSRCQLYAYSNIGDISVKLPKETKINTMTHSGIGKVVNEFDNSTTENILTAKTHVGNITIQQN